MEESHSANDSQKKKDLVVRYKEMLKNDSMQYFDVHEFEHIINYYRYSNRLKAAVYAIEIALDQHPNTFSIRQKYAEVLIDKKEYNLALKTLNELVELSPSNSQVLMLQGRALNCLGNKSNAVKTYKLAVEKQFGAAKVELMYTCAMELQQVNHYTEAIIFLKMAKDAGLNHSALIYDLAFCYEKIGEYAKSVENYKAYLEITPHSTDGWYNLAIAYNYLEEPELALDAYDFALAIDPKFTSAIFNKANLLSELEEHADAIELYEEYLEVDPDNAEAVLYIGQCYDALGKAEKARKFYLQALSIDDSYAEAQYCLSLNYFVAQEFTDSLYFIKKALDFDKSVSDYWLIQANIYLCLGYLEKSIGSYEQSILLDIQQVEAWINLSDIFYNAGQIDQAVLLLAKSYEHNSDDATINYRYASYLLQSGDTTGLEQLEKGLQLDTDKLYEFLEWYPAYKVDTSVGKLLKIYDIDLKKH